MRKVIGIGETILDVIFRDNQPHAAVPGGSAFNGLVSLKRVGVEVSFISEFGNDPVGRLIRSFMEKNDIPTDWVDCFPNGKSPVSLVFLDEQQNAQYMVYKDYPSQRLEVALPRIEADDILLFGAYYALNPALRPKILELLQYARDRKALIYYDPNFRKPHAHEAIRLRPWVIENLEYSDIVRGSDEDFLHLFGKTDMPQVYEEHIRFYCDRFIATRGADGVDLFHGKQQAHFEVPELQPVSTVGAGDSFNAGIIFGLLKYGVRRDDLPTLAGDRWADIVRCGIDFATDVCGTYDNSISFAFAENQKGSIKIH